MTTENEVVTETVAEPVIDQGAAAKAQFDAEMEAKNAKAAAEHEIMMADLNARREEEAAIAAEQDAALAAVRAECDAYRDALTTEEQQ
jgi:hypothetical protein